MRRFSGLKPVLGDLMGAGALVRAVTIAYGEVPAASARGVPSFGNPSGSFPVPSAGRAVNTTHPNHVIGNGSAASCTSVAVVHDVAAGGIIAFNCGPRPVTLVMNATANVIKTRHRVVLDGGGLVTLSGGGKRRILYSDTCAGTWSTDDCVNQPYPQIVVQNITFEDGYSGARQATCAANIPSCWYGGVDGGGAIYIEGGQFKRSSRGSSTTAATPTGPTSAAAPSAHWRSIRTARSTSRATRSSADAVPMAGLSAASASSGTSSTASSATTGRSAGGANPASRGTPGGGSGGAIYLDGTDDNLLIAGTVMDGNAARAGGGAVFDVVDSGWGALTFNQSQLHNDMSGQFQTFPGVYCNLDGHDRPPVMIKSTDR